jgi:inosose dehydratase
MIQSAAERALAADVPAAFHPHTATYVETPEEVAALLEATDPDVVSIAFDTGHTVVGGGDPAAFAREARDRISHLHLKDVDPRVLARLRSQELTVDQAWERGLLQSTGAVDFPPSSRGLTVSPAGRLSSWIGSPGRRPARLRGRRAKPRCAAVTTRARTSRCRR